MVGFYQIGILIFVKLSTIQSIIFDIPIQLKNENGTDIFTTFHFNSDNDDLLMKTRTFCDEFVISDSFCSLMYNRANEMIFDRYPFDKLDININSDPLHNQNINANTTIVNDGVQQNSITIPIEVKSPYINKTAVFSITERDDPISKLSMFCIEHRLDHQGCNALKHEMDKQYELQYNRSIYSNTATTTTTTTTTTNNSNNTFIASQHDEYRYNASYRFQQIFSNIYDTCYWESYLNDPALYYSTTDTLGKCSGIGSRLDTTVQLRHYLYSLFQRLSIRKFLDAPCGAMAWMPTLLEQIENEPFLFPSFEYTGIDVVTHVIDSLKHDYQSKSRWKFYAFDITSASSWQKHNMNHDDDDDRNNVNNKSQEISSSSASSSSSSSSVSSSLSSSSSSSVSSSSVSYDLIMAKDIFFHLTFDYIKCTLNNFKDTNSTYLLATSHKITRSLSTSTTNNNSDNNDNNSSSSSSTDSNSNSKYNNNDSNNNNFNNNDNDNNSSSNNNNNNNNNSNDIVHSNVELEGGEMFGSIIRYRTIDLTLQPFALPPPIEEFHGDYIDATMGLWLLQNIPYYTEDSHNNPLNCHD